MQLVRMLVKRPKAKKKSKKLSLYILNAKEKLATICTKRVDKYKLK